MIKLNRQQKNIIYFLLFLLNFLVSHFYPSLLFLINLLALTVLHFKKKYQIRNYISFFLFILWPCCFYIYLYCFVNAVVNYGTLLLEIHESPFFIRMNMESFSFWILRFCAVSKVPFPILGFELNLVYFQQFLFETFYWLAVISDVTNLSFGFKIWII